MPAGKKSRKHNRRAATSSVINVPDGVLPVKDHAAIHAVSVENSRGQPTIFRSLAIGIEHPSDLLDPIPVDDRHVGNSALLICRDDPSGRLTGVPLSIARATQPSDLESYLTVTLIDTPFYHQHNRSLHRRRAG